MRSVILLSAFALLTSAAFAHHGWGSYDASKPVTVATLSDDMRNGHAELRESLPGDLAGLWSEEGSFERKLAAWRVVFEACGLTPAFKER